MTTSPSVTPPEVYADLIFTWAISSTLNYSSGPDRSFQHRWKVVNDNLYPPDLEHEPLLQLVQVHMS